MLILQNLMLQDPDPNLPILVLPSKRAQRTDTPRLTKAGIILNVLLEVFAPCMLCQEQKKTKLLELAVVKTKVRQFVAPTQSAIEHLSSWTMKPPPNAATEKPSNIGVILVGQFYVYGVTKKMAKRTNKVLGSTYQAASSCALQSFASRINGTCWQVDKKEGVTVSWGKSVLFASYPQSILLQNSSNQA